MAADVRGLAQLGPHCGKASHSCYLACLIAIVPDLILLTGLSLGTEAQVAMRMMCRR